MPNWYWEKKDLRNTPSQNKGMDFDTETRYRREGVRFIMELGKALNLSHNTMATGGVYYHRFYMFHSFQEFPRYVTSTCCLFLAGKAEETPKKCRDLVKTVRQLTNDRQFSTFGNDPREEIMILERVLLQTIKFDLQVEHPYDSIIRFAKSLKGDQQKLQKNGADVLDFRQRQFVHHSEPSMGVGNHCNCRHVLGCQVVQVRNQGLGK